ncbi:hypothetical protein PMAYCL1PPCAC_30505 [Pristionchus mayeri]|uniref:XK-related protein n=1 Tax=Pristionchus mayeri TaxID=1317129 RepID=A0AAN5DDW0_9BILA|nr:hypothetical protein PMAYCL1PPCAC_30505 [Pristionchus mayeri]
MLFAKHQPKLIYLSRDAQRRRRNGAEEVTNDTDAVPEVIRLRNFDLVFYLISMFSYVADIASDVVVAYTHYTENRLLSALLILVFAFVPSFILNVVAYIWMNDEDVERKNNRKCNVVRIVCCLLQLGPILYYWRAFRAGVRVKRSEEGNEKRRDYLKMIECERDATLLRFFEAFMESCPQLLIQGFLLAAVVWNSDPRREIPSKVFILCASVFFSLLSVALSYSNQHRTLRFSRSDKLNMLIYETMIQLVWRFCTILSRFLVLIILCLAKTYWIVPFFAIHYMISIVHIVALQSISIGVDGAPTMELGLILINGCIHFFAPFNMAEGNTRWRYATAYSIEIMEAIIIFVIALSENSFNFPYKFEFLYLSAISFSIGFTFMIIYYTIFHPTKRKYRGEAETDESARLNVEGRETSQVEEIKADSQL